MKAHIYLLFIKLTISIDLFSQKNKLNIENCNLEMTIYENEKVFEVLLDAIIQDSIDLFSTSKFTKRSILTDRNIAIRRIDTIQLMDPVTKRTELRIIQEPYTKSDILCFRYEKDFNAKLNLPPIAIGPKLRQKKKEGKILYWVKYDDLKNLLQRRGIDISLYRNIYKT